MLLEVTLNTNQLFRNQNMNQLLPHPILHNSSGPLPIRPHIYIYIYIYIYIERERERERKREEREEYSCLTKSTICLMIYKTHLRQTDMLALKSVINYLHIRVVELDPQPRHGRQVLAPRPFATFHRKEDYLKPDALLSQSLVRFDKLRDEYLAAVVRRLGEQNTCTGLGFQQKRPLKTVYVDRFLRRTRRVEIPKLV